MGKSRNTEVDDIDSDADADDDADDDLDDDGPDTDASEPKKKTGFSTFKQIMGTVLGSGYELVLGPFKSFKHLRKAFVELRQEFNQKNPEETKEARRKRIMAKVWTCVQHVAGCIACVAVIALAILMVGNPYGLAVAAGTLGIITGVAVGATIISLLAQKLAEKKASSATATLATMQEHREILKGLTTPQRMRELDTHLKTAENLHQAYKEGSRNPGSFLMQHATDPKYRGALLKTAHSIGGPQYEEIAASTLKTLDTLKEDSHGQAISYKQQTIHNDPKGLLVTVAEDHIQRFRDDQGNIQIRMNANSTDQALLLAMEVVAQKLGPLKMKPGRDITQIIKAVEAAKLATNPIDLSIDPIDIARINQQDPKIREYFHALLKVPAEKFKAHVAEQSSRSLGQIPDEIPSDWRRDLRPTQSAD